MDSFYSRGLEHCSELQARSKVGQAKNMGSIPFSQPSTQIPSGDAITREPSHVTPGQLSQSSQTNSHRAAYLGESGYMSMFSHEPAEDEAVSQEPVPENRPEVLPPVLQESYLDTYFDYCYTWCPILDRGNHAVMLGIH